MKEKIYLDNAATTKLHPKVLEKMLPYLKEHYGNPSSIHSYGRKVRVAVEESREVIADFINADPSEIYFTSGGTEANNFLITGIAKTELSESGKNHIITTKAEHKSVLETYKNLAQKNFTAKLITNKELDKLKKFVNANTSLVSTIHINNETGKINNLEKIKEQISKPFFHVDATQSFGKIKIDVKQLGIHALSASAHKIYGPKGIGIAYVKSRTPMNSLLFGGGQERNRRAGTENVPGIIGFAEAVKIAKKNMTANFKQVIKLKNYFWDCLKESGINNIYTNSKINSSPYILSITFDPHYYSNDPESTLMFLDINGISASVGSACTSGTLKPSHVILAEGKSEEYAKGTIRFSFSPENTFEEIEYTTGIMKKLSG
ncbi:MAG: cysteine desulfurase NifS [Ignavibacteriae bacterium]|nr:MAG: cysteine desulfurase NifS [Ignavibacteriota bacterium]